MRNFYGKLLYRGNLKHLGVTCTVFDVVIGIE